MGGEADSLTVPAEPERLGEVLGFVHDRARTLGADEALMARVDLVLEELLLNVASHAYPDGGGELEIACLLESAEAGPRLCLRLRDHGRPFDPLASAAPDLDAGVDERPIGGLGIHLVRNMTDSLSYERRDDTNELRACFAL